MRLKGIHSRLPRKLCGHFFVPITLLAVVGRVFFCFKDVESIISYCGYIRGNSGGESQLPSEKILKQKQEQVEALTNQLKDATTGVIVDYKGISVADDTKLRKELREAGVHYMVVKNSLLRRASENVGLGELCNVFVGTTAIALCSDYSSAAKILCKYADSSKGKFSVKAGYVEGEVLSADGVVALSKLPSREELVAMVLRGFNAPISGFVNVLNANIRGLVVALNQIAEKSA